MEETYLLLFVGITLLISFILKYFIADKFRFPAVTIYVLLGVVLGISILKVFDLKSLENLAFISKLALGIISFIIGCELNKKVIKSLGKSILYIALFESFLAFILVTGAIMILNIFPFYFAIILGAVASATAPAATVYVIRQYKAKGPLTSSIMGVVGIDDAIALIIYVFAATFTAGFLSGTKVAIDKAIIQSIINILGSLGIGMVMGFIYFLIFRKIRDNEIVLMGIFAFILIQLGVSEILRISELLTIMTFGAFITNFDQLATKKALNNLESLTPLLLPLFFIFAGAHLNINLIIEIGLVGIVYTVVRMIGKWGGASLGAIIGKAPKVVRKYIGFSLIPQVGVAIALALSVQDKFGKGDYGEKGIYLSSIVINILLFTTIITEIVGPLLTKFSLKKANEINKID